MSDSQGSARFGVFGVPNFARYFASQLITHTGVWFQNLTVALIIVGETGSAGALGWVTVAQFAPMLLLGGWAGRLADRFAPRTILLMATAAAMVVALLLLVAIGDGEGAQGTATGHTNLLAVYGLLFVGGIAQAFERVAGQAIIYEVVGPQLLHKAVVVATTCISAGRSLGPGLAGLAFLAWGGQGCLAINAAACAVAFLALVWVRPARLHARRINAVRATTWENLRVVGANRPLVALLIVNVLVTIAAMNMNIVITSTVTLDFDGGAGELGLAHVINAVGAVVGAAVVARAAAIGVGALAPAAVCLAVALAVNGAAPSLTAFLWLAPILGIGVGVYNAVLQSAAQSSVAPEHIGRTMALVSIGNYGMAPVGAIAIGFLIDHSSGRSAFFVGATTALLCAIFLYFFIVRPNRKGGTLS